MDPVKSSRVGSVQVQADLIPLPKRRFSSISYQRLALGIADYLTDLNLLIKRCQAEENIWQRVGVHLTTAAQCLKQAQEALRDNNPDLGWKHFKTARRLDLHGWYALDREGQYRARCLAIQREAEEKLGDSWRKKTISDTLKYKGPRHPDQVVLHDEVNEAFGKSTRKTTTIHLLDDETEPPEPPTSLSVDALIYVAQILDEHHDNVYQRLGIIRERLLLLDCIAVVALLVWIAWMLISAPIDFTATFAATPIAAWQLYGLTILLGLNGALVSGFATTQETSKAKIPEQLQTTEVSVARLVMGAVSAVALATFLSSGILNLSSNALPVILFAAFAAGFSEQLVVKAVETVASKVGK